MLSEACGGNYRYSNYVYEIVLSRKLSEIFGNFDWTASQVNNFLSFVLEFLYVQRYDIILDKPIVMIRIICKSWTTNSGDDIILISSK